MGHGLMTDKWLVIMWNYTRFKERHSKHNEITWKSNFSYLVIWISSFVHQKKRHQSRGALGWRPVRIGRSCRTYRISCRVSGVFRIVRLPIRNQLDPTLPGASGTQRMQIRLNHLWLFLTALPTPLLFLRGPELDQQVLPGEGTVLGHLFHLLYRMGRLWLMI